MSYHIKACASDSLIKIILAPFLKGIGMVKLNDLPSGLENNAL